MTPERQLERLDGRIVKLKVALRDAGGPSRVALADLFVDEVWTSLAFAHSPLDRAETAAAVTRGVALGGHAIEAYDAVADYATAAAYARSLPMPSRRHPHLAVDEIVAVAARVMRRSSARAGTFREISLRAFPDGMVPPPAWMIPQNIAGFVESVRRGPEPQTSALRFVAIAHGRFARIQPFENGNGRVARLLVNLLLRRSGYPPLVIRAHDAAAYRAALRAADSRDPLPFALLLARSLVATYATLSASAPGTGDLRPLSDFASGRERAALYKAAQRGRLRAFRRAGRLLTTQAWIGEYRATPNAPEGQGFVDGAS